MRVYLSVDLEGINGVLHSSHTQPGESGYERAISLMHAETNAVIEGLVAAGADSVLVNDSHWDMRNLRIEQLHPKASLIGGWQKPFSMVSGVQQSQSSAHEKSAVDQKIDAACFVGYHSKAGTATGVLSHTYRATIFFDVKLNGRSVGETGLNAALAGYFGVPIAFVCGDDALCRESAEWLSKDVTAVAVKTAVSRYSALCPPHQETLELLKAKASEALRKKESWFLLTPPEPSTLEITFFDPSMADAAELIPGMKRTGDRTVQFSDADYGVVFKAMLAAGALGASRKDNYF